MSSLSRAYGNVRRVFDKDNMLKFFTPKKKTKLYQKDNMLKLVQILTKLYVWFLYFGFGSQIFMVFILVILFLKFFFILVLMIFLRIK